MTSIPSLGPSNFPHPLAGAALTAGRFETLRVLGSGGMATVYEVLDRSTLKRVALKRLHADDDRKRQRRMLELFEREFYTLSQIEHPRVVAVYDYGIDDQGAYYTMELLDGEALHGGGPRSYRQVCSIGRDISSALALLHSRRMVYRDLNPRNVFVAREGSAKLLDFGAVTNMGLSRQVVGTPGYCAPEALNHQVLDARTDLYSLGATLYFALTGRHAYPCKQFDQLRGFWSAPPPRPSQLVDDVPPALDALIIALMDLDPTLRPANAAEVMEQLAAIDGARIEEQLQVSRAYLVTPTLVGREPLLARVRVKLLRMLRGHGAAVVFEGASGVGRTRLLNACLLEAKILGALVLRADASDAREDYGVVQALASELLELAPDLALSCAGAARPVLGIAVPELLERPEPVARAQFASRDQERLQLMAAVREWFAAVAAARPLLMAVDDLHRIDEPSATLLALSAHAAAGQPWVVLATRELGASSTAPAALALFENAATSVQVGNLNALQVEELLGSVFGAVPHTQQLAEQLHGIAAGNPRDTLQLAEYLVDHGVARYQAGAWSLPARFEDVELPANMAQALRVRVAAISGRARELGRLISLIRDRNVGEEECAALYTEQPKRLLSEAFGELNAQQIVKRTPDGYGIAHAGFHAALQDGLEPDECARLHRLAAELFARRGDDEFRRAIHLMQAGAHAAGLDVLVPYAAHSSELTGADPDAFVKLLRSMPEDWLAWYTRALACCDELHRPARHALILRDRLVGLLNVMRAPSATGRLHLLALQSSLLEPSGLLDYAALPIDLPPKLRMERALAQAQARFDATPDTARTLPPSAAIGALLRSHVAAIGMVAAAHDYALWEAIVSLRPLLPLSAAAGVTEMFCRGVGARVAGRHEQARAIYHELLERSQSPEYADLPPTSIRMVRYGVMAALGMMEAGMGLPSCVSWADAVEDDPLFRVSSYLIRMLNELWQGRVRDADEWSERLELLRVQSNPQRVSDGIHLVAQASAHANSDDLTRLKHVLDEIRELTNRHSGWIHVLHYAAGEYQRVRGDADQAALQLRAAMDGIRAGTHQIWPHAAGALTRVLGAQGRWHEAIEFASRSLGEAQAGELGYLDNYIRMPLALALSATGRFEEAAQHADAVIASFQSMNSTGLNLVLAYETRTRVAMRARDDAAIEHFGQLCADACRGAGSRVLRAKYERLLRATPGTIAAHGGNAAPLTTVIGTQLTSVLVGCDKPHERAERCLSLLRRGSGASDGFLFLVGDHGPQLAAKLGANEPPAGLANFVSEVIERELQDRDLKTGSLECEDESVDAPRLVAGHGAEHRLVLLHHQQPEGFAITGAAALLLEPNHPFKHPGALAAHLSRLLFDAGDVTPLLGD